MSWDQSYLLLAGIKQAYIRDIGSPKTFVIQIIPREVSKPRVGLHLIRPIESKSVHWLALNHLHSLHLTLLMKFTASRDHPSGT